MKYLSFQKYAIPDTSLDIHLFWVCLIRIEAELGRIVAL